MNLLDSLRRAVRHYPGGLDAVAVRLGKSPSTLDKELRGAQQYKMGADDAVEIAAMCAQLGTEHALEYPTRVAEAVGCTLLQLPTGPMTPCCALTAASMAELVREFSDVISSAALADADGEISRNELTGVQRHWAELVASGQTFMRHLETKHEATMAKYRAREGGAA